MWNSTVVKVIRESHFLQSTSVLFLEGDILSEKGFMSF
jgi:hypothetical protein